MLSLAARGIGKLALAVGLLVVVAFGAPSLVLPGRPAAAAGLALYALILAALRPRGLREAWHYVRSLDHA